MKRGLGVVGIGIIGLLLSGAGGISTAFAQSSASPVEVPVSDWWQHGDVDIGGRFFLNDPQRNGSVYKGQDSLAKYYEYSDIRPGLYGDFWLSNGTRDGLYRFDIGGTNVGYRDQSYFVDLSKAGEQYLNLGWDQTPHLYSTSAQTFYRGVGTTSLTLPAGFPVLTTVNFGAATGLATISPFLFGTDIGIQRETASAQYRWTPTDAWDIKAEYSHMARTGTQIDGVVGMGPNGASGSPGFPYGPTQVIMPVHDSTQNYALNGEYAGTSAWGKPFTFKVGYKGSQYSDDLSSYTIQSPFCAPGAAPCPAGGGDLSPVLRESLAPSNQMNGFVSTLAADLPWNSRYVGTANYSRMTQNAAFIPMTNYPGVAFALPAASLNGDINTILSNNVITTKLTPELTSKLSYRFYNFDNNTPMILFGPAGSATAWISYDQKNAAESAIQSLTMHYTKQNAGEELIWRPSREWNLGAAYGYERYDYTQVDATSTTENSGKVFADWKPTNWLTVRSSGFYSVRTAGNYNYLSNVGFIQFPGMFPSTYTGLPLAPTTAGDGYFYSSNYQQLMIDNRDRLKANLLVDVVVAPGLTVTPTFKYQDDNYPLNPNDPNHQMGLKDSRSWSAGIDAGYKFRPDLTFNFSYMYESYNQLLWGQTCSSNAPVPIAGFCSYSATTFNTTLNQWANTADRTNVNTFTAAARYAAIPDKLDFDLRYVAALGRDDMKLNLSGCVAVAPPAHTGSILPTCPAQFPDNRTWFQHFEANMIYKIDPATVSQLGGKGAETKVVVRYVWERNSVNNWQNDPLAPYSPVVSTQGIWLASDNPNYNVHMLMAGLRTTW